MLPHNMIYTSGHQHLLELVGLIGQGIAQGIRQPNEVTARGFDFNDCRHQSTPTSYLPYEALHCVRVCCAAEPVSHQSTTRITALLSSAYGTRLFVVFTTAACCSRKLLHSKQAHAAMHWLTSVSHDYFPQQACSDSNPLSQTQRSHGSMHL